ncbi:response regulator transcription factor [Methylobacterium oxalidis]|uniref:response regulator transcription factor n=1 Tax=Methylobacterium oxalidis TaxID=944322 RepID=UPI003315F379
MQVTMIAAPQNAPGGAPELAHILLVEDDDGMRVLVIRILRESGYRVTGCRSGAEMWGLWSENPVDLVLLDVMLPGASGFDLLKAIRAKSAVPVIMLSARNEEADRVLGLELGADDYVAKPFGRPELLARIRAVLRRATIAATQTAAARPEALAFSGWRLDLRSRALTDPEGAAIDLSGAEFDLLLVFLEHPGRVLAREQILEMSRGRLASPSDRSVDTLVSRLRRKLEPPEGMPPVIKTVRGSGYMLAGKVDRT